MRHRPSLLLATFLLLAITTIPPALAKPEGHTKVLRGRIAEAGKAWATDFVMPRAHLAVVSLSAPAGAVDFAVEVKDPAGKTVYRQSVKDGSREAIAFKSGPIFAPAKGKYHVTVGDVGNDDGAPEQVFELGLSVRPDPDSHEPNHGETNGVSRAMATKLDSGRAVRAVISHRGDEDWYVLQGRTGQILDVRLSNGAAARSAVDYALSLFDGRGERFFDDWAKGDDGPTRHHVRKRLHETGPVYICVSDRDHDEYETVQSYELEATIADPKDRNEPVHGDFSHEEDEHRARIVTSGEKVTALIEHMGDSDWYRLDMKRGQILDVTLDNLPVMRSGLEYALGIYDGAFECRWQNWWRTEDRPLQVHARLMAREDGPMRVRVWSHGGRPFETENAYHLVMTAVDAVDGHEINDGPNTESSEQRATPLAPGTSVRGFIESSGDEDWFAVDVREGRLLDVSLSSLAWDRLDVDLRLVVRDEDGTSLYDDWHRKGEPRRTAFTVPCRRDGKIYLRIFDHGNDDFDGSHGYDLLVDGAENPDGFEPNDGPNLAASFLMASRLELGQPVTAFIQHRGDRDTYAMQHEGGKLTLAFDGPVSPETPMRLGYTLYAPDGTEIASDWSGPSAPVRHRFERELPAGRYHVSIWTREFRHSRQSAYRLVWGEEKTEVSPPRVARLHVVPRTLSAPARVRLQWVTQNAERVRLRRGSTGDEIDVAPQGQASFHLGASERFELRASRGAESHERATGVMVRHRPILPSPPSGTAPAPSGGTDVETPAPTGGFTAGTFTPSGGPGPITLPVTPPPGESATAPAENAPEGRHVVLVHGTLGAARQMAPMAGHLERLSDEKGRRLFRCHAITLSGLAVKAGIEAYALELRNFVAGELPPDVPFDLVGYSQGGPICRLYAARHDPKGRVGKVVTVCATNHGTALGLITRIATAAGIAVGAPVVLPCMATSPVPATIRVLAPVGAAAGHAGAYAALRSIKDQELASEIIQSLYDDEKARRLDVHAIWFLQDRVVVPHHSACMQGGKNYPLDLAAHLKAPEHPAVLRLVEEILRDRAKASGPQHLDLKAMIALKLVRVRDTVGLPRPQLVAEINGVLDKTVVLDRAEEALVKVLRAVKGRADWADVWKALDHEALWTKFQGEEVGQLYEIIGPTAPILRALAKRSKTVIVQDVRDEAVKAAAPELRAELLAFLLSHTPLSTELHERVLSILEVSKAESQDTLNALVNRVGGAERLYGLVWLPERKKRLQALVPLTKPCPRCALSGKKGHVKTWVTHEVRVDCPDCTGGLKDCIWCKGTGKKGVDHPCPKCKGTGRHVCSWCGGDGKAGPRKRLKCGNPLFKGMSRHERPCPQCGGDGIIEAEACKNPFCGKGCPKGKVRCTNLRCKGTGSWVEQRKELEYGPCPECKGSGEVPR